MYAQDPIIKVRILGGEGILTGTKCIPKIDLVQFLLEGGGVKYKRRGGEDNGERKGKRKRDRR